jgi:hypothetical protein
LRLSGGGLCRCDGEYRRARARTAQLRAPSTSPTLKTSWSRRADVRRRDVRYSCPSSLLPNRPHVSLRHCKRVFTPFSQPRSSELTLESLGHRRLARNTGFATITHCEPVGSHREYRRARAPLSLKFTWGCSPAESRFDSRPRGICGQIRWLGERTLLVAQGKLFFDRNTVEIEPLASTKLWTDSTPA